MDERGMEQQLREVVLSSAPADAVAVYLYGSRARGDASPKSDIDLGLLLEGRPRPTLDGPGRRLEDAVEQALRTTTQVVVLNTASADLVHRVLRDGILLLDRDRAARIRFEVRSRNEYFDLEPMRRLYRRISA
jgi:predicted nucleotidyltransferase